MAVVPPKGWRIKMLPLLYKVHGHILLALPPSSPALGKTLHNTSCSSENVMVGYTSSKPGVYYRLLEITKRLLESTRDY